MASNVPKVQVYLVQFTAYYVRGGVCIAARDRESREWQTDHPALGRKLEGGLFVSDEGDIIPHNPDHIEPGDRLCFGGNAHDVVLTSGLISVIEVGEESLPNQSSGTPTIARA